MDLPAPDMPMMPWMSPLFTVRLILSSAVTAVAPLPYTFLSPVMRIMGVCSLIAVTSLHYYFAK